MANKYVSPTKLSLAVSKIKELINGKVSKSGDTMTGNLIVGSSKVQTNGYIESTWLKTTSVSNKGANTGKVAVIDESGWIYYRTPKEITDEAGITAGATVSEYTTSTSTSWIAQSDYYYQDITINGLTASDTPIVGLIPSLANHDDEWVAWGEVFKITTATNKLRLYASDAIDIALSIQIKVVK